MPDTDGKDWRELCAAAAEEPDDEKLSFLVTQILRAFDNSNLKNPRNNNRKNPPQSAGINRMTI